LEDYVKDLSRKEDTILLADDEPYNLQFIVDFLASLNYETVIADNVDKAILRMQEHRFRAVIADLSIPLLPPQSLLKDRDPLFQKYPGLLVADYARNHNHTGRQVIVYSVHDDAQVRELAGKLGLTYLLKGRPRIMKQEIKEVLSYDPLAKPKS
jgi:CheY-like chemotaxis protein